MTSVLHAALMRVVATCLICGIPTAAFAQVSSKELHQRIMDQCGEIGGVPGGVYECLQARSGKYADLLTAIYNDKLSTSGASRNALVEAQRSWLNFQKATCASERAEAEKEGRIFGPVTEESCDLRTTLERIENLSPGSLEEIDRVRTNYETCFARSYTPEHLGKHPDQLVTNMLVYFREFEIPGQAESSWSMQMVVRLRGNNKVARTGAECKPADLFGSGSPKSFRCTVDCDGGGAGLQGVELNELKVFLAPPLGYGGIALQSGQGDGGDCGEGEIVNITAASDDKLFLLKKVPLTECRRAIGP